MAVVSDTSALAQASAAPLPAYQTLIAACKPEQRYGNDWRRHPYCKDIGRLMLDRGHTLVARQIGFAILRNLAAATEADLRERRNLNWYMQTSIMSEASPLQPRDVDAIAAYYADWRALDDEIEILKRALRRAGKPDQAPADWSALPSLTR